MRYNHHFQNHFGSCLFLAKAYDPHRKREVELRALPGEFDVVGVTDGVDAWIAPVVGDPFSVSVARILEQLKAGVMPGQQKIRHRVVVKLDPGPASPPSRERKRIVTPTGRIVDPSPPMQQLPINPEEGKKVRRAILAAI